MFFSKYLLNAYDQTLLSNNIVWQEGNTWILIVMSVDKKDEEIYACDSGTLGPKETLKVRSTISLDSLQAPKSGFRPITDLGCQHGIR